MSVFKAAVAVTIGAGFAVLTGVDLGVGIACSMGGWIVAMGSKL